jgi:hypothetical protein
MNVLERLLVSVLVLAALACAGWLAVTHYGDARFEAGRAAAVAAGEKLRQAEAERHREAESDLRTRLGAADADAFRKEQEYATNLDAAQRRVRAGVDRLRCPASSVQPTAAASDRPAAVGPAADAEGEELVPDAAADVLGIGATIASLVRKYDRLNERFEKCRAVNAVP